MVLRTMYGYALRFSSIIFANSKWTKKYLPTDRDITILYPPCQFGIKNAAAKRRSGITTLVSIGQFRPEKKHMDQLKIIRLLLNKYPHLSGKFHLYIIGGVRNEDDKNLFESLTSYSQEQELSSHVSILANVSRDLKQELLEKASFGLHTMRDEHFGISIVEMMV